MSDYTLARSQKEVYKHALTDPGEFRILELQPGSTTENLKGRLEITRLSDEPSFEAISYRSDVPSKQNPHSIKLDGYELSIGQNLYDALLHFRNKTEIRRLWADQICIYQEDKSEIAGQMKTEIERLWADQICIYQGEESEIAGQMKIFGDIFQLASKVLIWLGPGNDNIDRAMDLFVNMLNRLRARDHYFENLEPGARPGNFAPAVVWRSTDAAVLRAFFSQDWFSRVWTLQEAALAQVAEVWCGTKVWPFPLFQEFEQKCQGDTRGHWAEAVGNINTGLGGADPENPDRYSTDALHTIALLADSAAVSLARVLNTLRKLDCTRNIDRIWSIIRCLPQNVAGALNVYREVGLVSQLYAEVAADQLSGGNMDFLSAAGLALRDISGEKKLASVDDMSLVPSWVADWTFRVRVHGLWVLDDDCRQKRQVSLYRAGRDVLNDRPIEVSKDRKLLCLHAKILEDTVGDLAERLVVPILPEGADARASDSLSDRAKYINEKMQPLDDQITKHFQLASKCAATSGYEDVQFACRSTLVGSVVSDGASSTAGGVFVRASDAQINFMFDDYHVGRFTVRVFAGCENPADGIADIQTMAYRKATYGGGDIGLNYVVGALAELGKGRRFFITDSGKYMGLAPDFTQAGDMICVIPGCCAPLVIRPQGGHYQLIGECYVHGIMDGELMDREDIPLVKITVE